MNDLTKIELEADCMQVFGDREDISYLSKTRLTNIYFIMAVGTNMIKIGKADNVKKRIKNMQTGNHNKLILLASYKAPHDEEGYLHHKLRKYRSRGEWFHLSDTIIDLLGSIKRGGQVNAHDFFNNLTSASK